MNPDELQKLPLFAGLSSEESSCLEQGEEITVAAGEIIAREGDPAIYFYVIVEGEIRVSKTYGNQKVVMAVHTPGKFFGEVPLLLDMWPTPIRSQAPCASPPKRSSNAITISPGTVTSSCSVPVQTKQPPRGWR